MNGEHFDYNEEMEKFLKILASAIDDNITDPQKIYDRINPELGKRGWWLRMDTINGKTKIFDKLRERYIK